MSVIKKPIGSQAYLWKIDTPGAQGHCMISAHGGPANLSGLMTGKDNITYPPFQVPSNTYFVFYGPHGVPLIDSGYEEVLKGYVIPLEVYGPGSKCPNYGLWKWQGYHHHPAAVALGKVTKRFIKTDDSTETYEAILKAYERQEMLDTMRKKKAQMMAANGGGHQRDSRRVVKYMDLFTIRYRPFRMHTTLKDMIQTIRKSGIRYKFVHCNFCRGISGGHEALQNKYSPLALTNVSRSTVSQLRSYYSEDVFFNPDEKRKYWGF